MLRRSITSSLLEDSPKAPLNERQLVSDEWTSIEMVPCTGAEPVTLRLGAR